jgi:hypothetical protein
VGIIDKTGNLAINPQFDMATAFTKAWRVCSWDTKWGSSTRKATFVINPQYEDLGGFGDKLAPVRFEGKWGFVDKTGTISPILNLRTPFSFFQAWRR